MFSGIPNTWCVRMIALPHKAYGPRHGLYDNIQMVMTAIVELELPVPSVDVYVRVLLPTGRLTVSPGLYVPPGLGVNCHLGVVRQVTSANQRRGNNYRHRSAVRGCDFLTVVIGREHSNPWPADCMAGSEKAWLAVVTCWDFTCPDLAGPATCDIPTMRVETTTLFPAASTISYRTR